MINLDKHFWNYKCYIFDLDDTLYNEKTYLISAYKEIANYIYTKFNIDEIVVKEFLIKEFFLKGRKNLFNKMINSFCLPKDVIKDLLIILRNHTLSENIILFPEVESLIGQLITKRKSIFILTNGNVEQQKNKINQIRWNGTNKRIKFIFANNILPKPAPDGIFFILDEYNFKFEESVFIGDSEVDKKCALDANINFININSFVTESDT